MIRGETYHFELVSNETARGLQDLGIGRRLPIGFGAQTDKSAEVIHPQAHRQVMLGDQLPGQTPGHPDVAVVVDHATENIPARLHAPPHQ